MAEIDGIKLSDEEVQEHLQSLIPEESELQFKYELGQLVFAMENNKVYSAKVTSRMIIENSHGDWKSTKEQKDTWQPFGRTGVWYATTHAQYEEHLLYASRKELLESL